jgi:hypothetical protein
MLWVKIENDKAQARLLHHSLFHLFVLDKSLGSVIIINNMLFFFSFYQ